MLMTPAHHIKTSLWSTGLASRHYNETGCIQEANTHNELKKDNLKWSLMMFHGSQTKIRRANEFHTLLLHQRLDPF
jgi:hypothetical protein